MSNRETTRPDTEIRIIEPIRVEIIDPLQEFAISVGRYIKKNLPDWVKYPLWVATACLIGYFVYFPWKFSNDTRALLERSLY